MMTVLRIFLCLTLGLPALAEKRFNRDVIKLAESKLYKSYKLDDNTFPYLERNDLAVSCMVYRGTKYYYVEVAVNNMRDQPVTVSPANFALRWRNQGYTVMSVDTAAPISEIQNAIHK